MRSLRVGHVHAVILILSVLCFTGQESDVEKAVISCIDSGNDNTFIAAGCEIPKMTPLENMSSGRYDIKRGDEKVI